MSFQDGSRLLEFSLRNAAPLHPQLMNSGKIHKNNSQLPTYCIAYGRHPVTARKEKTV